VPVKNNKVYIPLGNDCSIAHFLRKEKLREFALPFDWNVSPLKSVAMLIENRFENFLDPINLIYEEPCQRLLFEEHKILKIKEDIITPVICKKYEILLPHDFSIKGSGDLELVKRKYLKRINKFYDLMNSKNIDIVFIAADNTLNNWQDKLYKKNDIVWNNDFIAQKKILKKVIEKEFTNVNFSIVSLRKFKLKTKIKNLFK
jgi:hypothetical protein